MGMLSKLFGGKKSSTEKTIEHAVIVNFASSDFVLEFLYKIEDLLGPAITDANVGEYDGHEISVDGSKGTMYMYGPDGDKLYEIVYPILEKVPFMQNAQLRIRYGHPKDGVEEKIVIIRPNQSFN